MLNVLAETRTYVLTHDIPMHLNAFQMVGLKTPDAHDEILISFRDGLANLISEALPDVKVVSLDMQELSRKVWTEALKHKTSIRNNMVLSSCFEMSSPMRGRTLEINRIVDIDGNIIGIGPRPGCFHIDEQISGIAQSVDGHPVVLIEDGIFSGKTLAFVLKRLLEKRVNVHTIIVGILFQDGLEAIRKVYKGEIVVIQENHDPMEWMPDHDFFPFMPNCGRVLGVKMFDGVMPYYSHEGVSYTFPYIKPFGDLKNWASIPKEKCYEVSRFCLSRAIDFFSKMNLLNDRDLKIRDLIGVIPRVSVPIQLGATRFPSIDHPILEYLHDTLRED